MELITDMDLRYNCFGGQVDNPPVDHYLASHSCGGPCKKPLGSRCSNTSRASAETEMILSRLPAPLQPIAQGSERTPLGQRKLSCDDECGKLEKKRLLADTFGVELLGDFTSGDTGALGSEM
ncbi:hypothetical protein AXG93_3217s1220 [Marchantia polymorpha subsp. ruderalis]|uniref:Uncharacterized protein n=1 Tax=Marchantia polymorpha subsp. ruderalis TaxID=1480154 RepID=A0A176VYY3_MARPO|nr:hypothetical protein AXG93_3217s1220 [Marchantia polymorpha subsp. ruderalis]